MKLLTSLILAGSVLGKLSNLENTIISPKALEGDFINWNAANPVLAKQPWRQQGIDICSTSEDTFEIESVEINPDPPKKGAKLTATVIGNLKKEIGAGSKVKLQVKWNFVTLFRQTLDFCEALGNEPDLPQCPVEAGALKVTESVDIPDNAPPVKGNEGKLIC